METAVDSSPHDASSHPSHRHLLPATATLIDPPPAHFIQPVTVVPNSLSLDNMRSLSFRTTKMNIRELQDVYTIPQPELQALRNLHLHYPKLSRSFYDTPPALINQIISPDCIFSAHHGRLYLGTKAPYPVPNPAPCIPYNLNKPNSLRLIHVSLVGRHGTRNPTNNCLSRLTALEQWLMSEFSAPPPWLQQWSHVLQSYRQDPGSLTFEGEQELRGIGSRFAQLYARHLQPVRSTVRIRSSYKARAVCSAKSFLDGYLDACSKYELPQPVALLDTEQASESSDSISLDADPSDTEPSETDISDICAESSTSSLDTASLSSTEEDIPVEILPSGDDAVLRYFERNAEYAKFALQHKALTCNDMSRDPLCVYTKNIASRVSADLGASSSMHTDMVRAVIEACAFDFAHGRAATSMFCQVLTPKDTALLELFEKHHRPFYKAHKRFRAVPAPLVADLAESLRASVETPNSPSAHAADLRFAHAETLVPLLLILGIRTNGLNPLHPEFRPGLSAMSPFAANLAIELYEELDGLGDVRHFVRFRLHERYVECIPALGEHGATGVVELHHLLRFFDEILEEGKLRYK